MSKFYVQDKNNKPLDPTNPARARKLLNKGRAEVIQRERNYLLEKFDYKCVYCGKEGVPLEVEHIIPKSRGGSNKVDNLTISCCHCNQKKVTIMMLLLQQVVKIKIDLGIFNYGKWIRMKDDEGTTVNTNVKNVKLIKYRKGLCFVS